MCAVSDTGAGTVGEPEPLSATTAAGPFDPASHAAASMEVDLTNVATSEAEPEAVVAGTPDEVEPDPELEGEGSSRPTLPGGFGSQEPSRSCGVSKHGCSIWSCACWQARDWLLVWAGRRRPRRMIGHPPTACPAGGCLLGAAGVPPRGVLSGIARLLVEFLSGNVDLSVSLPHS